MLLWQLVLTPDDRLDLSDSGRAYEWLVSMEFVVPMHETGEGESKQRVPMANCWTDAHGRFFARRLLALRSLGARLERYPARTPRGEDFEADQLLSSYMRYVRVGIRRKPTRRSTPLRPLDREKFAGLRYELELTPEVVGRAVQEAGLEKALAQQRDTLRELDTFLAGAFVSLALKDHFPPRCARCGKELEETPKGRRSRAKCCKACEFLEWHDGLSKEEKRTRWKRDKKKQRNK